MKRYSRRGDGMSLFVRRESFKQYVNTFPLTTLILAINVVYFGLMHFFPGIDENDTIFKWGAYEYSAIQDGQYYRLIAPIFMQYTFSHFIFNMFSFYLFVSVLEKLIG